MALSDILKKKAIGHSRKGEYTFFEENEIISKLSDYSLNERSVVLFKPCESYWVLLTEKSLIYKRQNKITTIPYRELKNKETYLHRYQTYEFENLKISCDHIAIRKKSIFSKTVILPIEILSVFSFSESLNFIIRSTSHNSSHGKIR